MSGRTAPTGEYHLCKIYYICALETTISKIFQWYMYIVWAG